MASSSEGSLTNGQQPTQTDTPNRTTPIDNTNVPKPKRLACMICRKRKLKCDGVRPSCSTCSRLGHVCAYDEQRRKSGPKRGYVKALEERLKQVETLLKTQDPLPANTGSNKGLSMHGGPTPASQNGASSLPVVPEGPAAMNVPGADWDMDRRGFNDEETQQTAPIEDFNFSANIGMNMDDVGGNFTWEMIGLGLEEPLPPQDTIDELHQIYFEKVHPSMPMIHKYRYLAAMNLAPNQRPPVCLRYAMWTMACSIADKYNDMRDLFYQRARRYVEADYIKGYGEHVISVAHCQTHILLSCYEMKMMYFPRAWINTGSAVRLAQMIGLHRLDGTGLDVKQCLSPPKDWTEREERRRTFWMAFCEDRYASIGTGWPMIIDERDIKTHLPASEEAFDMSRPEQTQTLQDVINPSGASKVSSFGSVVLMSCLFGRNLVHLHRPDDDDQDDDLNGPFWKRHRMLDNIILNTSLCLPANLKLPQGVNNANVVFTNMSIHTSTICLHQAAIFKAEKNKLPTSVSAESKVRCITAANEIASIMRNISHMDLASMNPFLSFCLYVSARVFVQYLKSRPDDSQTADSLRFMLAAMNALKRRNPLTESFLVQLDVDLEVLVNSMPRLRSAFPRPGDSMSSSNPIFAASNEGVQPKKGVNGCDAREPDNIGGIMSFRDTCSFMSGDDRLTAAEQRIVESQNSTNPSNSGSTGFNSQAWMSTEQSMSGMTPSSGGMNGSVLNGTVGIAESQVTEGSPDSSTNGGADSRRLAPGGQQMGASTQGSYQDSSLMNQNDMNTAAQAGMATEGTRQFFTVPSGFVMDVNEQQGGYGMATTNGWVDMPGQTNMPPVGEGVLRALMNMGPMDAMDLSAWDTETGAMRHPDHRS